ncbi:Tat pathway signal protein, partial [Escherichia coli]|nr:Tat pathway signal protein [Escherichia coli]
SYPHCWRGEGPTRHIAFAPLLGHQYSHIWIDFRGIRDKVMREAGMDYFENSRRSTYANRAYCIANPRGWDGWSKDIW